MDQNNVYAQEKIRVWFNQQLADVGLIDGDDVGDKVGLLDGDTVGEAVGLVGLKLAEGGSLLVGVADVVGRVEGAVDTVGEEVGAQLFDVRQLK